MTLIKVDKLEHFYGKNKVLHACSFDINKGEIVALLGESGSGKTTILRALAGFEKPTSGRIKMNEQVLYDANTLINPELRNIGLVFQDYALFPHLTVKKNIQLGQAKDAEKSVQQWLSMVGLEEMADRRPDQLSGGQQQRVAIARAMAANPALLLLDEPFSNIDESLKFGFRHELKTLLKAENVSAVFVTHDTKDALAIADKIVILKDGKVQQTGTPLEVYNKPVNTYVAGLFGPFNIIEEEAKEASIVRAEACSISSSGTKAIVASSMFQGQNHLINLHMNNTIWVCEHADALTENDEVFVSYDANDVLKVMKS